MKNHVSLWRGMTKSKYLLIAELVICLSGASFFLGALGVFLLTDTLRFPPPVLAILLTIFAAGLAGLIGISRLANAILAGDSSAIDKPVFSLVYSGIAAASLLIPAGLLTAHGVVMAMGASAILCALHFISLSKQNSSTLAEAARCEPQHASGNILKAVRSMSTTAVHTFLLLTVSAGVFVATWLLLRESTILWYGHSLEVHAQESAEAVAKGDDYCLIFSYPATTFAELDKRAIISRAFGYYFGPESFAMHHQRLPHFGIKVGRKFYHWSFMQEHFIEQPHRYPADFKCTKDSQPIPWGGSGFLSEIK